MRRDVRCGSDRWAVVASVSRGDHGRMDVPVQRRRRALSALPMEECQLRLLMLNGRSSGRLDRGPFWCRADGNTFALVQGELPWIGPQGPSTLTIKGRLAALPAGAMVEYHHAVRAWALLVAAPRCSPS